MARFTLRRALAAAFLLLAAWPAAAGAVGPDDPAAQWLPRSDGAEWVYAWSDSQYSPTARREVYRVTSRAGTSFRVNWQETDLGQFDSPGAGFADFTHTDGGLVNTSYQATPPPPQFPVLCAQAAQCGNSMAGTYFMLFWGTRSPVLAEPVVKGLRWDSLGGVDNDVPGSNRYVGRERIAVPAFPGGIETAKVQSDVTQAGALGDPYGSGLRTVWWAYGVGPVRIVFQHAGGQSSQSELQSTTLAPLPLPTDVNLLPLRKDARATYRWRNNRHMRRWSRQRATVSQVVNNSARVDFEDLSGPIDVAASYVFSSRLSGVTNLTAVTRRAATQAKFPRLGGERRRFATAYDLMTYGFNPVLPAHAVKGQTWRSSRDTRDWSTFGVTGSSTVLGPRKVRTPAGRFKATVVRSTLRQKGRRFGSGTRTSWFAPGRGLVKLVFRHDDGSVSRVERTR